MLHSLGCLFRPLPTTSSQLGSVEVVVVRVEVGVMVHGGGNGSGVRVGILNIYMYTSGFQSSEVSQEANCLKVIFCGIFSKHS